MANRALVDYVKDRITQGMNADQIRTMLFKEGWTQGDIEDALAEAVSLAKIRTKKLHRINYVVVVVTTIIILLLAAAMFMLVLRQTQNEEPEKVPVEQVEKTCNQITDAYDKDACYLKENRRNVDYDCLVLSESERDFCLRAKETVLLEAYGA